MKKYKIFAIILAMVLAVFAVAACACGDKPQSQELNVTLPALNDNQMVVVIRNGENDFKSIAVTLGDGGVDAKNMEDVLAYLVEMGKITLDWSDSQYGKELHSIDKIQPDASKNEFVTYLTSVEVDFGTWADVVTYTIKDVKLVSSGKGLSTMTVQPGAVVLFELATY